jgi:hypothetical protein
MRCRSAPSSRRSMRAVRRSSRAEVVALGKVGAGQLIVLRVLVRMKIAGTPGSGSSWKELHRVARAQGPTLRGMGSGKRAEVRQSACLTNATGTRVSSPSGEGPFCLTLSATEALDYAPTGRSGERSGALAWVLMPPARNPRARTIARLWSRLWCQRQARGMREGLSRR